MIANLKLPNQHANENSNNNKKRHFIRTTYSFSKLGLKGSKHSSFIIPCFESLYHCTNWLRWLASLCLSLCLICKMEKINNCIPVCVIKIESRALWTLGQCSTALLWVRLINMIKNDQNKARTVAQWIKCSQFRLDTRV